jgi:hypothetical protein
MVVPQRQAEFPNRPAERMSYASARMLQNDPERT